MNFLTPVPIINAIYLIGAIATFIGMIHSFITKDGSLSVLDVLGSLFVATFWIVIIFIFPDPFIKALENMVIWKKK